MQLLLKLLWVCKGTESHLGQLKRSVFPAIFMNLECFIALLFSCFITFYRKEASSSPGVWSHNVTLSKHKADLFSAWHKKDLTVSGRRDQSAVSLGKTSCPFHRSQNTLFSTGCRKLIWRTWVTYYFSCPVCIYYCSFWFVYLRIFVVVTHVCLFNISGQDDILKRFRPTTPPIIIRPFPFEGFILLPLLSIFHSALTTRTQGCSRS